MNNKVENEILETYYRMINEYIWFSADVEKTIQQFDSKIFINEAYMNVLEMHVNEIVSNNIYPVNVIDNIYIMIMKYLELINQNKDEIVVRHYRKRYLTLIDLLRIIPEEELNNFDFAEIEYVSKYSNLEEYNQLKAVPYSDIVKSIRYDFEAFNAILNNDKEAMKFKKEYMINQNYFILFIKKLLITSPNVLKDQEIKEFIIDVLKNNISENNHLKEISQELLYRITNFKECNCQGFDENDFKLLYFEALINSLSCSLDINKDLKELDKSIITHPYFNIVFNHIITSLDGSRDEEGIQNLKEINYFLNDNYKKLWDPRLHEEVLNYINSNKGYLNLENKYDKSFYYQESLEHLGIIKGVHYSLFHDKDLEEIKEMIRTYFKTLNSYTVNNNEFINNDSELIYDDYYINAINKLLDCNAYVFTDKTIFNRTKSILKDKINCMKQDDPLNIRYCTSHKKVLKKLKVFGEINE